MFIGWLESGVGGLGGGLVVAIWEVMQKGQSPDFTFPEVRISV